MRKAIMVACVLAACGGNKDDRAAPGATAGSATGSGTGATARSAAVADAAPSTGAAPHGAVTVDRTSIQQVVDAWLAAQNSGDFAAYSALYAARFGGVKRVGPRTWIFDRAGWLEDRARMFKAPMQVSATAITIAGGPTAASVALTQRYTQGRFSDQGEKYLVIVREGTSYKIAREEMLRSEVTTGASTPGAASVHLITEVNGEAVVILGAADAAVTHGALEGPFAASDRMLVTAPVTSPVPPQELAVIAADGTTCIGKLTAPIVVAGGTPHFGMVQEWNQPDDGSPPVADSVRAAAVFAMTPPYLAGVVANGAGDCKGVVAVPVGTRVTAFAPAPTPALETAAIAAFRKQAQWKQIQSEWQASDGATGPWEASATAKAFVGAGRTFVAVSAEEGRGCGDFEGSLAVLFEIKNGTPTMLGTTDRLDVIAMFDLDGDGQVELVSEQLDWSSPVGLLDVRGNSPTLAADPLASAPPTGGAVGPRLAAGALASAPPKGGAVGPRLAAGPRASAPPKGGAARLTVREVVTFPFQDCGC